MPALRLAAKATARIALEYGRLLRSMTSPPDDLAMVRCSLRGDSTALGSLVTRLQCVPRMLAARNAKAGRPLADDEVADAAHEVIARVWAQLGEYRGQAALESWVYRFCEFELLNAVRRKRRGPRSIEAEPASSPPDATEVVDTERVHRALDRLPQQESRVVCARHFAGLAFEQIAGDEGVPLATVKSRYYRAMDRLRFWLAPLAEGDS